MAKAKRDRVRKNFVFPSEIADWAQKYARDHNTSMTQLIVDYFTTLKKQAESGYADQI